MTFLFPEQNKNFFYQTPLAELTKYCEMGKKHNYPVSGILAGQVECNNDDVTLKLFSLGVEQNWWDENAVPELLTLLERIPMKDCHLESLQAILPHLDTLKLKLPIRKRIAVIWAHYIQKYNDTGFLFLRIKTLLGRYDLPKAFRLAQDQFRGIQSIVGKLAIPFDGDMNLVMQAAMHPKGTIDKNLLNRMELRRLADYSASNSRFREVIKKIDPADSESWKLASRVFIKIGNEENSEIVLKHLKLNRCGDELLTLIQYCLQREIPFDSIYGYMAALEMAPTDISASVDLVKKMRADKKFDAKILLDLQAKVYATLAFSTDESTFEWANLALSIQDQRFWKGQEQILIKCAQHCHNLNENGLMKAFLAKISDTIQKEDPLFAQVCNLWTFAPKSSSHAEEVEILSKYQVYLSSRTNEAGFMQHLGSLVEEELSQKKINVQRCLKLLIGYQLERPDLWIKLLSMINSSKDTAIQQKVCAIWTELSPSTRVALWAPISDMMVVCDIKGTNKILQMMIEQNLPTTETLLAKTLKASLDLLSIKKGNQEERIALTKALLILKNKKDLTNWANEINLLLTNCLLLVRTVDNLNACCDLWVTSELLTHETFIKILEQCASLPKVRRDELHKKIHVMAKKVLDTCKSAEPLLQIALHLKELKCPSFEIVCCHYFTNCITEKDFSTLNQKSRGDFLTLLERLTLLNNSDIIKIILLTLDACAKVIRSLFPQKKLPTFLEKFFDQKILEFLNETHNDQANWKGKYLMILKYADLLFSKEHRLRALDKFLDLLVTTFCHMDDSKKTAIIDEYCSVFEPEELNHCRHALTKKLIESMSAFAQNTEDFKILYLYLNSSLIAIPKLIADKKANLSMLDERTIILFIQFCNCWPKLDQNLLLRHCANTVVLSKIIRMKQPGADLGILKTTITKIMKALVKDFEKFNAKNLEGLMRFLVTSLDLSKPQRTKENYQKQIKEIITTLREVQNKFKMVNPHFLNSLCLLGCEVENRDECIENLLINLWQILDNELKETEPNFVYFSQFISDGFKKLLLHCVKQGFMAKNPQKYKFIYDRLIDVLDRYKMHPLNILQKNDLDEILNVLKVKSMVAIRI
jgi:hypothetical protein